MPVSPGRDDDHPAHVRLEQPGDFPRAAGHLQRDPVGPAKTVDQRPDPLGRRGHPPGRVHLPLLADRDLDEVKVHIQPDAPAQRLDSNLLTSPPIACDCYMGDRRRTSGRTTQTDTRSQRTRASRRGRHRKARARSPSSKTACPTAFSTTRIPPVPGARYYATGPEIPAGEIFMPRGAPLWPDCCWHAKEKTVTAGYSKRAVLRAHPLPWPDECSCDPARAGSAAALATKRIPGRASC